jgi:hypothetical protein
MSNNFARSACLFGTFLTKLVPIVENISQQVMVLLYRYMVHIASI